MLRPDFSPIFHHHPNQPNTMNALTTTAPAYQFDRKAYMSGQCTHQEYNAQFVTPAVLATVKNVIGIKAIKASTDEHLNDIALSTWDRLNWSSDSQRMVAESNASTYGEKDKHIRAVSLSDKVCVMKAAARMLKADPTL